MKKIIMLIGMFVVVSAHATNDDVVNSQMYVDNLVDGLQTNLPAKTSDKVVTYTTTAGTTGERDIKTTLGDESTNQADTGIATVGTVNAAIDSKQDKKQISPLSDVNVITYTGTNNDSNYYGRGVVVTTPIYDSNVNTFDNGLVRAKTLNDAVIAGVNAEATKITTDPKGALWVFNRTAPKVLPTTANLSTTMGVVGFCNFDINDSEATNSSSNVGCSSALVNNMVHGDWGVRFDTNTGITYPEGVTCSGNACGKEVQGISACSNIDIGSAAGDIVSSEYDTTLETAYNNCKNGCTLPSSHKVCYCKLTNPSVAAARWLRTSRYGSFATCANQCAEQCEANLRLTRRFRAAMFSAAPLPAQ